MSEIISSIDPVNLKNVKFIRGLSVEELFAISENCKFSFKQKEIVNLYLEKNLVVDNVLNLYFNC